MVTMCWLQMNWDYLLESPLQDVAAMLSPSVLAGLAGSGGPAVPPAGPSAPVGQGDAHRNVVSHPIMNILFHILSYDSIHWARVVGDGPFPLTERRPVTQ